MEVTWEHAKYKILKLTKIRFCFVTNKSHNFKQEGAPDVSYAFTKLIMVGKKTPFKTKEHSRRPLTLPLPLVHMGW